MTGRTYEARIHEETGVAYTGSATSDRVGFACQTVGRQQTVTSEAGNMTGSTGSQICVSRIPRITHTHSPCLRSVLPTGQTTRGCFRRATRTRDMASLAGSSRRITESSGQAVTRSAG